MDSLEKRLDQIFRRKHTLVLFLLLFLGLCALGGWHEIISADKAESGKGQIIEEVQ